MKTFLLLLWLCAPHTGDRWWPLVTIHMQHSYPGAHCHSAQSSGEIANFLICHCCHWRYLQPAPAGHVAPATRQNNYLYPPTRTFIYSHLPLYTLARSARGPTVEMGHKREAASVCAALHVSTPGMYVAMWALSGFPEECALVVRCVKKTNFREQKAGCNWSPNLPRCH